MSARNLFCCLLFLTLCFTTLGQDSVYFDLKVRVSLLRTRRLVPDAGVEVIDSTGRPIFEGCTDANGEVFLDSSLIRPGSVYRILIKQDGSYSNRNGTLINTDLPYPQNFVVDIAFLPKSECWYYACFEPSDTFTAKDYDAIANAMANTQEQLSEAGMPVKKVAVWIHYETWDQEKRLRRAARQLQKSIRKRFPDLELDPEIRVEYHPDHVHTACVRVVRLE